MNITFINGVRVRVVLVTLLSVLALTGVQASDYKKCISGFSATVNDDAQTVTVKMQVAVPADIVPGDQSLCVTPVLVSATGEVRKELPSIRFTGKRWAPYYRRARNLQGHDEFIAKTPYAERILGKELEPVQYQVTSSYQKGDKVVVRFGAIDCCTLHELANVEILIDEPMPEPEPLAPIVITKDNLTPFVQAEPEQEKHREEEVVVRVQFKLADDVILPSYKDNQAELNRIEKLLEPILTNQDLYTIDRGYITGYASPEGAANYNQKLSERRAKSLQKYITSKYPKADLARLDVTGYGDDWEGLRAAIEDASIANGDELINIINGTSDVAKRKQLLSANPSYKTIYETLYPPLRRTIINVKYIAKGVTRREAKELFLTRPKDLSVYEAYDAISDLEGKYSLLELHKIIADSHQTNAVAQVNYSTLLLQQKKADEALQVLRRVEKDPLAFNNIAVCYILKGEFATAREYLLKAPKSKLTEGNLKMIEGR